MGCQGGGSGLCEQQGFLTTAYGIVSLVPLSCCFQSRPFCRVLQRAMTGTLAELGRLCVLGVFLLTLRGFETSFPQGNGADFSLESKAIPRAIPFPLNGQ